MTTHDPRELRNAFGSFLTGVTVVTSIDHNGLPIGFTANSFTSVSLDPPLLLVCLANSSVNKETFLHAPGFAVNVLSEDQIAVSNTFARPVDDRFANITWHTGPAGSPLIEGVSAWFDCTLHQSVEAGDHVILIGRVDAFDTAALPGLGYVRGSYIQPSAAQQALAQHARLQVSAIIEREGRILLLKGEEGRYALPARSVDHEGSRVALQSLLDSFKVTISTGFVYSVYDDRERQAQHLVFLAQAGEGDVDTGEWVSIAQLPELHMADTAEATMLARFSAERALGNHGLYVGDHQHGVVRQLGEE